MGSHMNGPWSHFCEEIQTTGVLSCSRLLFPFLWNSTIRFWVWKWRKETCKGGILRSGRRKAEWLNLVKWFGLTLSSGVVEKKPREEPALCKFMSSCHFTPTLIQNQCLFNRQPDWKGGAHGLTRQPYCCSARSSQFFFDPQAMLARGVRTQSPQASAKSIPHFRLPILNQQHHTATTPLLSDSYTCLSLKREQITNFFPFCE